MPGHHHRSGGLRQSNKRNKRSKASKRSASRAAGGKVMGGIKGNALHGMAQQSKADRRHHGVQRRNAKRAERMRQRRGLDGQPPPPRVVGLLSLGPNPGEVEDKLRAVFLKQADQVIESLSGAASVTCRYDVHKKQGSVTLLTSRTAFGGKGDDHDAIMAALDMARVCDLLLVVLDGNGAKPEDHIQEIQIGGDASVSTKKTSTTLGHSEWDHLISDEGDRILTALKAQGLPSVLTVLLDSASNVPLDDLVTMQSIKSLRRSRVKRHLDLRKYVSRFATTEFGTGHDKVLEVDVSGNDPDDNNDAMDQDNPQEDEIETVSVADKAQTNSVANLLRTVCSMSAEPSKWVSASPRPYVLADSYQYDESTQELQLTGYVRGLVPLSVNSLFHIPGIGTYHCKALAEATRPLARRHNGSSSQGNIKPVLTADPEVQESLERFATPDSLEGEQNLIGFDDHEAAVDDDNDEDETDQKFARPAGWSDYQSAWLDAVDDDAASDVAADHGELADALNAKSKDKSVAGDANDMELDDSNSVSSSERRVLYEQRRKEQSEHEEFPDEVQVMEDVQARDRFARYRALKSFRRSPWDPKENLPDTYASIFHLSHFKTTQRSVVNYCKDVARESEAHQANFWGSTPGFNATMTDDDDDEDILEGHVPSGAYVTLTFPNVEAAHMQRVAPASMLVAAGLLEHENKASVVHAGLSRSSGAVADGLPIKSKDTLLFRCGWRTWRARPVFSQNNLNCDKHKFERFMPPTGAFFAASLFGPVTYSPCPVLVFRENEDDDVMGGTTSRELLASGSILGADADRIVVKRVVLTGSPVRVHKRFATVKYMFYNPEDVKWFKPADLYTKHGLQGNILESVGDHGTMKCLFNAPIKQHDTVCLPLFKRIYPKFAASTKDQSEIPQLAIW